MQHNPSFLIPDAKNNYPIHTIAKNLLVNELQEIEKFKRTHPNLQFSVDTTNKHGKTALHLVSKQKNAFLKQSTALTELLLKMGANPNAKDSKNNSPLHYAASYGGLSVCNTLIKANADVKALNSEGKSPFDMILCGADLTLTLDDTESNFLRSNLVEVLTQQRHSHGNFTQVSVGGSDHLVSVQPPPAPLNTQASFTDVLKTYKDDIEKEVVIQVTIEITTFSPNPRKCLFTSIKLNWTIGEVILHILGVLSITSRSSNFFQLYRNNNLLGVNSVVSQQNFKAKEQLVFKEL